MAGIVLKIVLEDTHPPVWRRIIVPADTSFYELHQVIQMIFGWEDMHMHIFEAPKRSYEIVAGREDVADNYFLETDIPVSAVAERESWIRYVYDMGDEWRHKIIFEKQIPDYPNDYATLMKVKGNNYMEDTGGIWFGEQENESYDAVYVNSKLEQMKIKGVSLSEENRKLLDDGFPDQFAEMEIRKFLRQIWNEAKGIHGIDAFGEEKTGISQMDEQLFAWQQFCFKNEMGAVCKMAPRKTSQELLETMDEEKLKIMNYALQPDENEGVTGCRASEMVLDVFGHHPEYYFSIFNKEDLKAASALLSAEYRQKIEMPDETVQKGIMLGLWHIQVPEKTEAAYLFPALDFETIMDKIQKAETEFGYQEMQEFGEKVKQIILAYGVIEQNAFFEAFEKRWNTGFEKKEFLRRTYLDGLFAEKFAVWKDEQTGELFIGVDELDFEEILSQRKKYASELSYKQFTGKELQKYSQPLYAEEDWDTVHMIIKDYFGMEETEADIFVEDCYMDICNGDGITQILGSMELYEGGSALVHTSALWQIFINQVMNMRLPMLNGYSRLEYQNLTGKDAFSIDVFQKEKLSDLVEPDTPLMLMPEKIQKMVFYALSQRGSERPKALEQVTKQLKERNNELDVLMALAYVDAEKYTKACNILDDVADRTEDDSVIEVIDTLCGRAENIVRNDCLFGDPFINVQMETTYQRETPKIGRNDLCPCGSGKKYKKCCGK